MAKRFEDFLKMPKKELAWIAYKNQWDGYCPDDVWDMVINHIDIDADEEEYIAIAKQIINLETAEYILDKAVEHAYSYEYPITHDAIEDLVMDYVDHSKTYQQILEELDIQEASYVG